MTMRKMMLPGAVVAGIAVFTALPAMAQTVVTPELAPVAPRVYSAPEVASIGPPMPGTATEQRPAASGQVATTAGTVTTSAASVAAPVGASAPRRERARSARPASDAYQPVRVAIAPTRSAYLGREEAPRILQRATQAPVVRDVGRFWPPVF
jgi:hypothetical protein